MINIVQFSGGKDSLATLIWAKQNLDEFKVVFCDTGWESDVTYRHIEDVSKWLNVDIVTLKSKFDFRSLSLKKKRVASTKARFCTDYLKVRPFIDFLLMINDDITVYQGIRADESPARRTMSAEDDFFSGYISGKHTYRKKAILKYLDSYSVDVVRPLFKWTAIEVFDFIKKNGLVPNELYRAGLSRVGCFPCVMARHSEVKIISKINPERIELIRSLENELGRSFFPKGYIPDWACKNKEYPLIDDVLNYLINENQLELFEAPKCQSIYAICE